MGCAQDFGKQSPRSAERIETLPDSTARRILRGIVCQKEVVMHQFHPPRRHSPPGGEFTTDCLSSTGDAIWVNGNTSCPFAHNVLEQYAAANPEGAASGAESWVINAWSPVTNQNYTMTCLREGDAVICRGGNDAAVFFYIQ